MIEAEGRNGGLGTDSSEGETGKEELQALRIEGSEDRIEGEVDGSRFGGIEALIRACILERRQIFAYDFIEHDQVPHCRSPIGLCEKSTPSPLLASIAYNHQQDKRDDNDNSVCVEDDVRFDGNGVCVENSGGGDRWATGCRQV